MAAQSPPEADMSLILTLVNTAGLDAAVETQAPALLRAGGAQVGETRRFGNALDLHFTGPAPDLRSLPWPVDAALQPAAFRHKRLLVSDMESTLVRNEFLDDLADRAGMGEAVSAITARAMNGEIDFAGSLRARLALLAGQPVRLLEEAWERLCWMPGARELIRELAANGVRTVIVSGGFHFFADRVRELLGADACFANRLEIADGRLTGQAQEPILDRESKQRILESEAKALGIAREETLAVGDGANDLPMLRGAGLGVAYHAKPAVAAAVACRVQHSDLRALLAFAGIG